MPPDDDSSASVTMHASPRRAERRRAARTRVRSARVAAEDDSASVTMHGNREYSRDTTASDDDDDASLAWSTVHAGQRRVEYAEPSQTTGAPSPKEQRNAIGVVDTLDADHARATDNGASYAFKRRRDDFFAQRPSELRDALAPPWAPDVASDELARVVEWTRLELRDREALERAPLYVFATAAANAANVPVDRFVAVERQTRQPTAYARDAFVDSPALDVLDDARARALERADDARRTNQWLARTAATGTVVVRAELRAAMADAHSELVRRAPPDAAVASLAPLALALAPDDIALQFAALTGAVYVARRPATWRRASDARHYRDAIVTAARALARVERSSDGRLFESRFRSTAALERDRRRAAFAPYNVGARAFE